MMDAKRAGNRYIRTIFFGNYFYGLCVLALSMEAALQQLHPLNSFGYYLLVFIATVLYYTKAYIPSRGVNSPNPRTRWYARNKQVLVRSQQILTVVFLSAAAVYAVIYLKGILHIPLMNWLLLVLFPLIAVLYYGIDHHFFGRINLRSIGWLKPFLIGMIWAAAVTIYPVVFSGVEQRGEFYEVNIIGSFLFLKNFMFVTVLCIMFDIKDYADDSNRQIKTFVVKVGLRKTIFSIILPLSALGLASFIAYAVARHFSSMKIFMNVIPFVALLVVAYSMHRRQSILYYLIAIDGLMLLKGLCGSIAMTFF